MPARRPRATAAFIALAVLALCSADVSRAGGAGTTSCPRRTSTPAYAPPSRGPSGSTRDLWGEQLLASRGGPTYEAASRYLTPLLFGQQRGRRPLTRSGVYYLPFALPLNVYGPAVLRAPRRRREPDRHAERQRAEPHRAGRPVRARDLRRLPRPASRRRSSPTATSRSCRPATPTGTAPATGRSPSQGASTAPPRSSASCVSASTHGVAPGGVVRLVPSLPQLSAADDRLLTAAGARLIVSAGGAYDGHAFRFTVPARRDGRRLRALAQPSRPRPVARRRRDDVRANARRRDALLGNSGSTPARRSPSRSRASSRRSARLLVQQIATPGGTAPATHTRRCRSWRRSTRRR